MENRAPFIVPVVNVHSLETKKRSIVIGKHTQIEKKQGQLVMQGLANAALPNNKRPSFA